MSQIIYQTLYEQQDSFAVDDYTGVFNEGKPFSEKELRSKRFGGIILSPQDSFEEIEAFIETNIAAGVKIVRIGFYPLWNEDTSNFVSKQAEELYNAVADFINTQVFENHGYVNLFSYEYSYCFGHK